MKHFNKCKIIICHDSLGDTNDGPTLYHIMAELFKSHDMIQMLHTARFHYLDNMVVLEKRDTPIVYKNWNITEKDDNRKDPYID